jgi:hypothetical protein
MRDEIPSSTDVRARPGYDHQEIALLWTASNDAQTFVVLGDPAVRLPV